MCERVRGRGAAGGERRAEKQQQKPSYFMQFNSLITFFAFSFHSVALFSFIVLCGFVLFYTFLRNNTSATSYTVSNTFVVVYLLDGKNVHTKTKR